MIQNISEHYEELTEGEKQVLHFILSHTTQAIKMTSQAIADECHVSKTVLITMAQTLGFEGFNDLKFYLKRNQKMEKEEPSHNAIETTLVDNVERTIQINSSDALDLVANEILESKCVYIVARGSSKALASYFGHMLLTLNIKCVVNPDFNLLSLIAKSMEKEEIMICMSLSGKTRIMVETAKQVKARGNKMIAMTSFTNNELSRLSDATIYCVSDEVDTKEHDTISRISMFAAIELVMDRVKKRMRQKQKQ